MGKRCRRPRDSYSAECERRIREMNEETEKINLSRHPTWTRSKRSWTEDWGCEDSLCLLDQICEFVAHPLGKDFGKLTLPDERTYTPTSSYGRETLYWTKPKNKKAD